MLSKNFSEIVQAQYFIIVLSSSIQLISHVSLSPKANNNKLNIMFISPELFPHTNNT